MKRNYRVAFSAAATAGLLGGAGAALGTIPAIHSIAISSSPLARSVVSPAAQSELTRLKAELGRTSGDARQVRARIARMEADIARAQRLRKQRASQAAAQLAAAQRAASGPSQASSEPSAGPSPVTYHQPSNPTWVARPMSVPLASAKPSAGPTALTTRQPAAPPSDAQLPAPAPVGTSTGAGGTSSAQPGDDDSEPGERG